MRKLLLLILIGIFLAGCSDQSLESRKYKNLLSEDEGSYSVYMVASKESTLTFEELEKHNLAGDVSSIVHEMSVESARFEVEEFPTFMVFDTEKKVYETNEREKLITFLKENKIE